MAEYEARQSALKEERLFSPQGRHKIEVEIAKTAGVDAQDVYVYCPPRAPGHGRVRHWVSPTPGAALAVDSVSGGYRRLADKHLGLWELWVFTSCREPREVSRVAGAAEERFGFENLIGVDRRAGRLF